MLWESIDCAITGCLLHKSMANESMKHHLKLSKLHRHWHLGCKFSAYIEWEVWGNLITCIWGCKKIETQSKNGS